MRPKPSMGCVLIDYIYLKLLFWYENLRDTSLHAYSSYGYFNSIEFTFEKLSKAIESRRITQWVSAFILQIQNLFHCCFLRVVPPPFGVQGALIFTASQ